MGHDHKAPKSSHWKAKDQQVSHYGRRRRGRRSHQGKMNGASDDFHPSAAHSPHKTETLPHHVPHPTRLPAAVWKSEWVKEREKFDRTLKKVSYFAPGFVNCGLFPRNQDEWRVLRFDYTRDQLAAKEYDKNVLAARIEAMSSIPPQGRNIKSIFGPEGKEMKFSGGSVLGWQTIWSKYQHCHAAQSVWPTTAELLTHGDNRSNFGRLYRSFPRPRAQGKAVARSFEELQFICAFPLDEIEPEFTCGPTYAEYTTRNAEYDNDESFKVELEKWLDSGLKEAIGGNVEKWLDVVGREGNREGRSKILAMDKHEKDGKGKAEEKNGQRKIEGKDQQGGGEKKHQQVPNKGRGRRRRNRYHHPKVDQSSPMTNQLPQPGMMTRGRGGMRLPIPSAYSNNPPPYPYPGYGHGPGNVHGHGHGYRYGSWGHGRQALRGGNVAPVTGTQRGPAPFVYARWMANGRYGSPQHDGSWESTQPRLAAIPE